MPILCAATVVTFLLPVLFSIPEKRTSAMAILPRDSTATFDDTSEYFEDQYGDGVQCHQLSATENPYFSVSGILSFMM